MFAVAIESEKIGEIGPTQGQLELAFRFGEIQPRNPFYELRTFGERQKCHVVTRDASDTL